MSKKKLKNISFDAKSRNKRLKDDKGISFERTNNDVKITKKEDDDIFKYIIQRYKEKSFDNFRIELAEEITKEEIFDDSDITDKKKSIISQWEEIESNIKNLFIKSYK